MSHDPDDKDTAYTQYLPEDVDSDLSHSENQLLSNIEDVRLPEKMGNEDLADDGYEKRVPDVDIATLIDFENFDQTFFEDVHRHLASTLVTSSGAEDWAAISTIILDATRDFEGALDSLAENADWQGETQKAAIDNIRASLDEPRKAAVGAGVQGVLVEDFKNTIATTYENIAFNWGDYVRYVKEGSDQVTGGRNDYYAIRVDELKQAYDSFARAVMLEAYAPNIVNIANANPVFTAGGAAVGDPGPDDTNSSGGGGGFDAPAIPDTPAIPDEPAIPDLGGATGPDLTDTMPTVGTSPNASPSSSTSPLDGLTHPMQAASDALGNALSPAADALKQGAEGADSPFGPGEGGPPEGALDLGPTGVGGSPSIGGAGGRTGAGAGAKLPRSLASGKPGGAPVKPASTLRSARTVAGAGPGAMGPPGAGAPAGAQRGGDNSKGHQVLKALRRKKTGQQVAGEADAVVPVVGAPEKAAKPEADQSDQADQLSADVRSAPRRAHRPEQSTQVPSP